MFTGIIEEIGVIENIRRGDKYCNLTVKAKKVLDDVHIGDSIAVNGICLTVTYFNTDIFTADIMNETWNRTALKKLDRGSKVNLERDFYISVIPHTLEQTILRNKKVNDIVNLENDIIGKYIKKFVENDSGISKEFLLNNGF